MKTLNDKEKALLLHCLEEHAPSLVSKIESLADLDIDTINDMRNAIGSELANEGFEPDSEPNRYGLELEDLIGKLADLYIWPKER